MGQGVYIDLTLIYERKSYRAPPRSYPDYAGGEIIAMLNN